MCYRANPHPRRNLRCDVYDDLHGHLHRPGSSRLALEFRSPDHRAGGRPAHSHRSPAWCDHWTQGITSLTINCRALLKSYLLLLFLVAPLLARAQSEDYWEIYGGYQATRGDTSYLQTKAEQLIGTAARADKGLWMNGGSLSLAEYKRPWFAGVIDLTAAKGMTTLRYAPDPSLPPLSLGNANPALYTLTAGPQFRIPYRGRIQPIARVLFGAARVNLSLDPQLEDALKTLNPPTRSTQTSFAVQTGGGLDYRLTPHFSLRSTAEYLGTWFYHDHQTNLLISGGAVFHW
jgi:hypothetical protein